MTDTLNEDITSFFVSAILEITSDEEITDKLFDLRYTALTTLLKKLRALQKEGVRTDLLLAIAKKKTAMIRKVTSKTEMEKLMNPRPPYYNGSGFIPNVYHIPEEELIAWSKVSLTAPLGSVGFARYSELFRQIFPKESLRIFPIQKNDEEINRV